MSGFQNGTLVLNPPFPQTMQIFNDGTVTFNFTNSHGSPQGVVTANVGSICTDTTNGNLYIKNTGSGNTGWVLLSTSLPTNFYSLSPFIVGPDINSQYSSIQAGINAAQGAGATATNPMNVYVKPKTGGYTENITIPDGVYVVSFSNPYYNTSASTGQTILNGSVTFNSNITSCGMTGIVLNPGALNIFNFTTASTSQSSIQLNNITVNANSSGKLFNVAGNSISAGFYLTNCYMITSGAFYTTSGTASSISLSTINSTVSCQGGSTLAANDSLTVSSTYSSISLGTITTVASNTATLSLDFTNATGSTFSSANISSATLSTRYSVPPTFSGSISANWVISHFFPTSTTAQSTISTQSNFLGKTTVASNSAIVQKGYTTFTGSDWIQAQTKLNSTSASAQTLVSVTPAAGESVILKGTIAAANAGHTDMTGGDFIAMADGTAAALVGNPVYHIFATSTGTFAASFSGGNLLIQVTPPSAAAYNYVCTYQYQKVLTNS